jgi:hypothetical protein
VYQHTHTHTHTHHHQCARNPQNTHRPAPTPPRQVPDISVKDAQKNLKKSLEKGILKILSKMGISLLSCYHGAQIFEAYGAPAAAACVRAGVCARAAWRVHVCVCKTR